MKTAKIANPHLFYVNMKKETVPCNICGSSDLAPVWEKDRYGMNLSTVLCRRCGFLFTNPRPTQDEMNEFYRTAYRQFYTGLLKPAKEYEDKLIVAKRQWFYERAKAPLEAAAGESPAILDVGCGSGVLLNVYRRNVPKSRLFGIEPYPLYAECAASKNGAQVFAGDADSFARDHADLAGTLDMISLYHVFEHLYNPVEKLLALRPFLKPGGILLIQVPHAFSPHWANATQMCHIAHISHFGLATLRHAYELAGFEVLKEFAGKHPGNPRAMTFVGVKTDRIKQRSQIAPLDSRVVDALHRSLVRMSYKGQKSKKAKADGPKKNLVKEALELYRERGFSAACDKLADTAKNRIRRKLKSKVSAVRKVYEDFAASVVRSARQKKHDAIFSELIRGQKVLIIGSGPSASELTTLPEGFKIFTCNAGMRLFVEKGWNRRVDLFLCRKKAMIEDYADVPGLVAKIKTDVFVMDDVKYVRSVPQLKGAYARLIREHQKDNFYLEKLIAPKTIDDIRANNVGWTSAGIRLLQYALHYGAAEIYIIGIDLANNGYFWKDKYKFKHADSGVRIVHKHPIDHNFLRVVSKKFKNVYSVSGRSLMAKYLPQRDLPQTSSPAVSRA